MQTVLLHSAVSMRCGLAVLHHSFRELCMLPKLILRKYLPRQLLPSRSPLQYHSQLRFSPLKWIYIFKSFHGCGLALIAPLMLLRLRGNLYQLQLLSYLACLHFKCTVPILFLLLCENTDKKQPETKGFIWLYMLPDHRSFLMEVRDGIQGRKWGQKPRSNVAC